MMEPGRNLVLRVDAFGQTDRGRKRPTNQDSFAIAELRRALFVRQSNLRQPDTLIGDELGHLFIVADGMGGYHGGEQASALAVETIEQFLLNTLGWLFGLSGDGVLTEFQQALRAADHRVVEAAAQKPQLGGMGTTVTMAYATGSTLYAAHVGDSRLYLWRRGDLMRVTSDHTVVARMVSQGVLSPEEAATHKMRHLITNSVGGPSEGVTPEIHKVALEAEDVLLLCSDGLTEMLPDAYIGDVLHAGKPAEMCCQSLIESANERGGHDNITAVVARFAAP
jgi:PPM family protein phosphatase